MQNVIAIFILDRRSNDYFSSSFAVIWQSNSSNLSVHFTRFDSGSIIENNHSMVCVEFTLSTINITFYLEHCDNTVPTAELNPSVVM